MNFEHNSDDWVWWKHGVIYHIYPRSFYDANNDGVGDIRGIIQKLDHLTNLGVDAIWLSPVNKSPMKDFGYDVSDFREIDPLFGTNEDFLALLEASHSRGIKVIMDLIMNHTSDLHPWFLESKSSLDNPKRDWYIWRSGKYNAGDFRSLFFKKPNNWITAFGGSAWQYDENTKQYYFHTFLKEQPDLNWRNKKLRSAFFKDIRYWLDLGVDGFRLDAINMIIKDKKFRDNFYLFSLFSGKNSSYTINRPKSYNIVEKLRKLLDKYDDRMTVGEIYAFPPGNPPIAASYLANGNDALHLTFDFSIMFRKWNANKYFKCIRKWNACIPKDGWPTNVLSNHDLNRSLNRFGTGKHKTEKAKVAAVFLLTLKGTPFVYYGEEIGMKNTNIKRKDLQDPLGKRFWLFYKGRDRARTPMQWNSSPNAGFSNSKPWLPVNSEFPVNNVEIQKNNKDSLYSLYRNVIAIRKKYTALHAGEWIPYIEGHDGILAYFRQYEEQKILVILNFKSSYGKCNLESGSYKILISTHKPNDEPTKSKEFIVSPFEASILIKLDNV